MSRWTCPRCHVVQSPTQKKSGADAPDFFPFYFGGFTEGIIRALWSVWRTQDPGRLRVPFSAEAGSGSHKTGSISASKVSSSLRISVNESCVTNLIRVPRWFFAAAWYTAAQRQNRQCRQCTCHHTWSDQFWVSCLPTRLAPRRKPHRHSQSPT